MMDQREIPDAAVEAAKRRIILEIQLYDFGHTDAEGNFTTTAQKIDLLEERAGKAARAALTAALPHLAAGRAEAVAAGWQTMETAPKDETEILGIQIHNGRASDPGIVRWDDFEQEWWDIDADQYGFPTHWLLLPGSALVSAPAVAAGWQTMETAPKDGTRILLAWEPFGGLSEHVELGKWKTGLGWCNTYGKPFSGDVDAWAPLAPFNGSALVPAPAAPTLAELTTPQGPEFFARHGAAPAAEAEPVAWLPWTGGLPPVPDDTPGHIRVADGEEFFSQDISSFNWSHDDAKGPVPDRRIVAYRAFVAAPTASQEALREALTHPYEDWRAAINFAVDHARIEAETFLRAWVHGEWDVLDREWPEWGAYLAALAQSDPVKGGDAT